MPSVSTSTRKRKPLPAKPYPEFPLGPHRSGKWCKRINGKLYYFGRLDDWEAALAQYEREMPYLKAGKTPPPDGETLVLKDLCNLFLEFKEGAVKTAELTQRSFNDYRATCVRLCELVGKRHRVVDLKPHDFAQLRKRLAKTLGPTSLGNEINRIRCVFKYAFDQELIEKQVRYGQGFKRPPARTLRKHRAEKRATNGAHMHQAEEIRALLRVASRQVKAMILLGVNCGLGNEDCGRLQVSHLDLDGGWLNYPRPKTGIERRAKMWPETIEAIEQVLKNRPKAKTAAARPCVFRTKYGDAWAKATRDNPITKEFRKLLDQTGIYRGVNFYGLRHSFETVAGDTRDQVAVNAVMGHVDTTMAAQYREGLSDERLVAVADHVRGWLFGDQADA